MFYYIWLHLQFVSEAEIEALRFPNVSVEYRIEDDGFLIPALTIQPLVENATVKKRLAVKPDPETHEKHNKGFETYKKLYPLHRKIDYGN